MQQLARQGYDKYDIGGLLTSASLNVDAGCELLDPALNVVADLSGDLQAGSVSRVMDATVHGSCTLSLSRALTWGVDLVRPYMLLTDNVSGNTVRFNVGVFALTTPQQALGESIPTYSVQGYDRLYLLNRPVGKSYSIAAGTKYLTAVKQVITDAGLSGVLLDGTAGDKVLAANMSWPLIRPADDPSNDGTTTTWLRIVNDLLAAVGYRGVWADENGLYRSEPYLSPQQRAVEFVFDTDDLTILGEQRTQTVDIWKVPNRWVFIQQNRDPDAAAPVEGNGVYTYDNLLDGPASQTLRGMVWSTVVQLDAADQASLVSQGNQRVNADMSVSTTLDVTTGPFPAAGHADVLQHIDPDLGPRKMQAMQWDLDLFGADTKWTWSSVS